jgi:hypothetical protein
VEPEGAAPLIPKPAIITANLPKINSHDIELRSFSVFKRSLPKIVASQQHEH